MMQCAAFLLFIVRCLPIHRFDVIIFPGKVYFRSRGVLIVGGFGRLGFDCVCIQMEISCPQICVDFRMKVVWSI
ncbi:hypothetical protein BKA61DRAFT_616202 [Leptodontidium sp. MPI-SDFR-AT-0119]|nr:hypothetical protein BKA61DRAFT_616202 [Leptodontidium sp. MPI-SDFR-AT-0119]